MVRAIIPVPQQKKGASSRTTFSRTAKSKQSAKELYEKTKQKLLDVNTWHCRAKHAAVFTIYTNEGKPAERPVVIGDFIRIDIPGIPGPTAGHGYEWVVVENITGNDQENENMVAMQVRPGSPPFISEKSVAHFFTENATSTFCVRRTNLYVEVLIIGRNERQNTKTRNWFDKIRNFLVGTAAMAGANKRQWKKLAHGLLAD